MNKFHRASPIKVHAVFLPEFMILHITHVQHFILFYLQSFIVFFSIGSNVNIILTSCLSVNVISQRPCRCTRSLKVTAVLWLFFQEGFKMGLTLEGTIFSLDPLDSRC